MGNLYSDKHKCRVASGWENKITILGKKEFLQRIYAYNSVRFCFKIAAEKTQICGEKFTPGRETVVKTGEKMEKIQMLFLITYLKCLKSCIFP